MRNREQGILLHPTSLPGHFGIGTMGAQAFEFIDILAHTHQTIWQILPLNYPGYGDSPYSAISAFAGNSCLINPELLQQDGLLTPLEVETFVLPDSVRVDFPTVRSNNIRMTQMAWKRFQKGQEYDRFCADNAYWLNDFSLYIALKQKNNGVVWTEWKESFSQREELLLKYKHEVEFHTFVQYLFFRQWNALKRYANSKGISIIGDIPIYVAFDSADVWSHSELFRMENGKPEYVAGVPPDYFSEDGQLWGNPLYRWDVMLENKYEWWYQRLLHAQKQADCIRIDHFIAFTRFWAVLATEETAINGNYENGPGTTFFELIISRLPDLKIIAEDLGVITKEVTTLKNQFGFSGMQVLHFRFWTEPIDFDANTVCYTGTHDNDTTLGWYNDIREQNNETYHAVNDYFNNGILSSSGEFTCDTNIVPLLIDLAFRSPARKVIIPLQDFLRLGTEYRMNTPGSAEGNWAWRYLSYQLTEEVQNHIQWLADNY
ncbi:MAG: 4-alpha-glucanotransferase [Candidatus Cloacimonetes bacterium]|nr:4-alpha-glucanotransferase [Candidatus Cloacimonadota bacterium]